MKSIFTKIIYILFLLPAFQISGQTVLLEENVKEFFEYKSQSGPNLKNYAHWYLEIGWFVDKVSGDSVEVNYGKTHTFTAGYRYKRKLTNWYAIGGDIQYGRLSYSIKQNEVKAFPTTDIHKRENFIVNNIGAELYQRINIGKRGNAIGKYIDMAAYGNWGFNIRHFYEDKLDVANLYHAKQVKVRNKNLNYAIPYNYGVRIRIGIERYAFSVTYRLSELLDDTYDFEFPRISLGIQIGLF